MTNAAEPLSTSLSDVNAAVERVQSRAQQWAELSASRRLQLLYSVRAATETAFSRWIEASYSVRGVGPPGTEHLRGFPVFASISVMTGTLSAFIERYEGIVAGTPPPYSIRHVQKHPVVKVLPDMSLLRNRLSLKGVVGEVWLQTDAEVEYGAGDSGTEGYDAGVAACDAPVCAVLSAGNYDASQDVLVSLFRNGRVAVLKTHPRSASALSPIFREVLAPLLPFVEIVDGGADVGQALVTHTSVGDTMMTGSLSNFRSLQECAPEKPMLGELGGVSPYIVVPGQWSDEQLEHHAQQLVAAKLANGSHVCASPQVLITDRSWRQRDAFLARVRQLLVETPGQNNFYSTAKESIDTFAAEEGAEVVWTPPPAKAAIQQRRIFATDVSRDSLFLKQEAFAPVLAEHAIDTGSDADQFLCAAVNLCNTELLGSLGASIIIDPDTEASLDLDQHIAQLQYGAIGVNVWALMVNSQMLLPWGAHPSNHDSGIGFLGNAAMLKNVEKGVLRTPFVSDYHMQLPDATGDLAQTLALGRFQVYPTNLRLFRFIFANITGF